MNTLYILIILLASLPLTEVLFADYGIGRIKDEVDNEQHC